MDILKKIAGGESITAEFKECRNKLPKNLFETICAFLNRMGGDIFLGVADDGTITGVEESCVPQLKKDISSLCNNANKIAPTVYLHTDECEVEGKTVLHIYVPESSQVHSTAGKIYDRNEEFTENTIYPYATLNDLETETIREVRIMAVNRQPNHPWEKLTDEELLKSCGLYKRDLQTGESGYTLACILLFGIYRQGSPVILLRVFFFSARMRLFFLRFRILRRMLFIVKKISTAMTIGTR